MNVDGVGLLSIGDPLPAPSMSVDEFKRRLFMLHPTVRAELARVTNNTNIRFRFQEFAIDAKEHWQSLIDARRAYERVDWSAFGPFVHREMRGKVRITIHFIRQKSLYIWMFGGPMYQAPLACPHFEFADVPMTTKDYQHADYSR